MWGQYSYSKNSDISKVILNYFIYYFLGRVGEVLISKFWMKKDFRSQGFVITNVNGKFFLGDCLHSSILFNPLGPSVSCLLNSFTISGQTQLQHSFTSIAIPGIALDEFLLLGLLAVAEWNMLELALKCACHSCQPHVLQPWEGQEGRHLRSLAPRLSPSASPLVLVPRMLLVWEQPAQLGCVQAWSFGGSKHYFSSVFCFLEHLVEV